MRSSSERIALTPQNHRKLTYSYGGRSFRLTNVSGEVARGVLA